MAEPQTENRQDAMDAADVDMRYVSRGAIAIVVGIAFAGLAAYVTYRSLQPAGDYGGPGAKADMHIAAPILQSAPQPDRATYFAEKERLLNSYGWVDKDKRIARIPIEQAMNILAGASGKQKDNQQRGQP